MPRTRFGKGRQGLVGIGFAVALMVLLAMSTGAFLLMLSAGGLQVERTEDTTQALLAAEAGIDLALQQSPHDILTGSLGKARYAARISGGHIAAVGEVMRAVGVPVRCAVEVRRGPGGVVRGSWLQVPPADQPKLLQALDQVRRDAEPGGTKP